MSGTSNVGCDVTAPIAPAARLAAWILGALGVVACIGAWAVNRHTTWIPTSFAVTFDGRHHLREQFHPDRTGIHTIVLDLRCEAAGANPEALLDPKGSSLPFTWQVGDGKSVIAHGGLGATRRQSWDPVQKRHCGQEVGRFVVSDIQPYEVAIDVDRSIEASICNPRIFVGPSWDATTGGFLLARCLGLAAAALWVAALVCLAYSLRRRRV